MSEITVIRDGDIANITSHCQFSSKGNNQGQKMHQPNSTFQGIMNAGLPDVDGLQAPSTCSPDSIQHGYKIVSPTKKHRFRHPQALTPVVSYPFR